MIPTCCPARQSDLTCSITPSGWALVVADSTGEDGVETVGVDEGAPSEEGEDSSGLEGMVEPAAVCDTEPLGAGWRSTLRLFGVGRMVGSSERCFSVVVGGLLFVE